MPTSVLVEGRRGSGCRPSLKPAEDVHSTAREEAAARSSRRVRTVPLKPDVDLQTLRVVWVQGMMAQCRRALRPDGLFLAALWGGDTLAELRIAHALAEQELEGGVSPRISPLAQVSPRPCPGKQGLVYKPKCLSA